MSSAPVFFSVQAAGSSNSKNPSPRARKIPENGHHGNKEAIEFFGEFGEEERTNGHKHRDDDGQKKKKKKEKRSKTKTELPPDDLEGSLNLHGAWDPDGSDSGDENKANMHDSFGSATGLGGKKKKKSKSKQKEEHPKSPRSLKMTMVGVKKQSSKRLGEGNAKKQSSSKRITPHENGGNDLDWFFPGQGEGETKEGEHKESHRGEKKLLKTDSKKYQSRRSSMMGRSHSAKDDLAKAAKAEHKKSRRRSVSTEKADDVVKESKSKPKLKKRNSSKTLKTRKPMRDLFTILDFEPWSENTGYTDDEVINAIEADPDACKKKYRFEFFGVVIYPFSMMCAVGASVEALQTCYEAFPEALSERDPWVGSPLHYSCGYEGPPKVVEWLLEKKPEMVTTINRLRRSPFHIACQFNPRAKILSVLLERAPMGLEVTDKYGNTPLHLACENGANMEILEIMTEKYPAACSKASQTGATPLHLALENRMSLSKVKVLVKADDTVLESKDSEGRCPLHIAVEEESDPKIIKFLAKASPKSLSMRTEWQCESALEMAQRLDVNPEIIDVLKQAKAKK